MPQIPYILSLVTFLPLVGAGLILLARLLNKGSADSAARWIALVTTVVTLAVSVVLVGAFDPSSAAYQFVERYEWFAAAQYHLGVDGISILFVLLTASLLPICIVASWKTITERVVDYMIAFLVLETLVIGVFTSLDLFLFYIFFEGTLVPMFIIIGVWGGANRIYAAYKFFLYTLLGSVLMLLAMLWMAAETGTTSIPELKEYAFSPTVQPLLWLAFFASFAVKMPMWPVHTWLPDAHVQAPTAGSVILAGILLKLGGYGFILFNLPMFPQASQTFAPLVFALSAIAIVYTSLVAFRQTDMKKLIAYSSVAHMGFVTMGIFAGNALGVQGAVFQMLSHGLISGALFLCVGVVYDRMHTREIALYGGLTARMPWFAAIFMLFTMANVGLPGTSGFIGEVLTLVGVYQVSTWTVLFAASGVIFSAVYALTLYRNVMFGEITNPAMKAITDVDKRELLIFAPLIIGTLWLGVQPGLVLDYTAASVEALTSAYQLAIGG